MIFYFNVRTGCSLKGFEISSVEKSDEMRQSERTLWNLVERMNAEIWEVQDFIGMERLKPTESTMQTLEKEVEAQEEEALTSSLFLRSSSKTYEEQLTDSIRKRMFWRGRNDFISRTSRRSYTS